MQSFPCNRIPVDYLVWDRMIPQLRCRLVDPYPRHLRHWWKARYKIFPSDRLVPHHQHIRMYISEKKFAQDRRSTTPYVKCFSRNSTVNFIRTMAVQSWSTLFGTFGGAQNFDLHSVGNGIESRAYSKQLKFSLPPAGSFVSSSHQAKHSLSSPQNIFNPFYGFKL